MTPARGRRRALARGLVGGATGLVSLAATAAPWYVEPTVTLYTTYQSNPQYYVTNPRSGTGELATLDLPFEWSDQRSTLALHPTANAGLAQGATGIGQHNRSLDSSGTWGYDQGKVRASATLSHLDLSGTTNFDLGIVRPIGYENVETTAVGTTWTPTELTTIDLDGVRSRNSFHIDTPTNFVDYTYSQLNGQWAYSTSERTQAIVSARYADYQPATGTLGSIDHSLQVGGSHAFTEALRLTATVGRSRVKLISSGDFIYGDVYLATLAYNRPTTTLIASARQSRQPGAVGDLAQTTEFSVNYTVQRTERLSHTLSGAYSRLEDTFSVFALQRRNYYSVDFETHYMLTSQWRFDAHVNKGRSQLPGDIAHPVALSATSAGGSIGISRVFGRTRLN